MTLKIASEKLEQIGDIFTVHIFDDHVYVYTPPIYNRLSVIARVSNVPTTLRLHLRLKTDL